MLALVFMCVFSVSKTAISAVWIPVMMFLFKRKNPPKTAQEEFWEPSTQRSFYFYRLRPVRDVCVCVCVYHAKYTPVSFMHVWLVCMKSFACFTLIRRVSEVPPSLLLSWIPANWKKRQKSVVLLWRKEKSSRGEAECNKKNPSTFTPSWNGRSSMYAYRPFLHKEALVAQIRRISLFLLPDLSAMWKIARLLHDCQHESDFHFLRSTLKKKKKRSGQKVWRLEIKSPMSHFLHFEKKKTALLWVT